jgi:hypothetical protein
MIYIEGQSLCGNGDIDLTRRYRLVSQPMGPLMVGVLATGVIIMKTNHMKTDQE